MKLLDGNTQSQTKLHRSLLLRGEGNKKNKKKKSSNKKKKTRKLTEAEEQALDAAFLAPEDDEEEGLKWAQQARLVQERIDDLRSAPPKEKVFPRNRKFEKEKANILIPRRVVDPNDQITPAGNLVLGAVVDNIRGMADAELPPAPQQLAEMASLVESVRTAAPSVEPIAEAIIQGMEDSERTETDEESIADVKMRRRAKLIADRKARQAQRDDAAAGFVTPKKRKLTLGARKNPSTKKRLRQSSSKKTPMQLLASIEKKNEKKAERLAKAQEKALEKSAKKSERKALSDMKKRIKSEYKSRSGALFGQQLEIDESAAKRGLNRLYKRIWEGKKPYTGLAADMNPLPKGYYPEPKVNEKKLQNRFGSACKGYATNHGTSWADIRDKQKECISGAYGGMKFLTDTHAHNPALLNTLASTFDPSVTYAPSRKATLQNWVNDELGLSYYQGKRNAKKRKTSSFIEFVRANRPAGMSWTAAMKHLKDSWRAHKSSSKQN